MIQDDVKPDRILKLEGINNFRDYGNYAVVGGGRVKSGVLWRSGQHVGATDADLKTVSDLGLSVVTDLRGDSERALNPCRRHPDFAAQVLTCEGETAALASHIDASRGVLTLEDARGAMRQLYSEMPYRPNLVAVMQQYFAALAVGSGPSLIHCFAGKDRTGMSVALAHHVLGVHPDDAMADYLLTNTAMVGRTFLGTAGKDSAQYASLAPEASQALGGVDASYLEAGFAAIRESHGSTNAYLEDVVGVNSAVQAQMREALIEG